jgi:hypothetical protein
VPRTARERSQHGASVVHRAPARSRHEPKGRNGRELLLREACSLRLYGRRTSPVRPLWVVASSPALHTGHMASDTAAATFVTGAPDSLALSWPRSSWPVAISSVSRGQWRRRTACVVPGRPHAQRTVRQPGKRSHELVSPNRIVVHEEIPTASFAVRREMHPRVLRKRSRPYEGLVDRKAGT